MSLSPALVDLVRVKLMFYVTSQITCISSFDNSYWRSGITVFRKIIKIAEQTFL